MMTTKSLSIAQLFEELFDKAANSSARIDAASQLRTILIKELKRINKSYKHTASEPLLCPPPEDTVQHYANANYATLVRSFEKLLKDREQKIRMNGAKIWGMIGATLMRDHMRDYCENVLLKYNAGKSKTAQVTAGTVALSVMQEFLRSVSSILVDPYVHVLLARMRSFIETLTFNDMLPQCLSIMQSLVQSHHQQVSEQFTELVDLLVGVGLTLNTTSTAFTSLSDCFLKMRPLWITNKDMTNELVLTFVADIDELLKAPQTGDTLLRLCSFIECFVMVANATGPCFVNICSSILSPFVQHLSTAVSLIPSQRLSISVLNAIRVFIQHFKESFVTLFYGKCVTIFLQQLRLANLNHSTTSTVLKLHLKVRTITSVSSFSFEQLLSRLQDKVPIAVLESLFTAGSPFLALRVIRNTAIATLVLDTYKNLLARQEPEIHVLLNNHLKSEIEYLLEKYAFTDSIRDGNNNVSCTLYHPVLGKLSIPERNTIFCADVLLLALFPDHQDSFTFLMSVAHPFTSPVASRPGLQFPVAAVLHQISTLYVLCAEMLEFTCPSGVLEAVERLAEWHGELITGLLSSSSEKLNLLAIAWLRSICSTQCPAAPLHEIRRSLYRIIQLAMSPDANVRREVVLLLLSEVEHATRLQNALLFNTKEIVHYHIACLAWHMSTSESDSDIRSSYSSLASLLVPIVDVCSSSVCVSHEKSPSHSCRTCIRRSMSLLCADLMDSQILQEHSLSPQEFQMIMNYISMRPSAHLPSDWQSRIFDTADFPSFFNKWAAEYDHSHPLDLQYIPSPLQEYVILSATADFFIHERLRTPFGGPMESFGAIERMFLRIVAIEDSYERGPARPTLARSGAVSQVALRFLLKFVSMFEKHVYNASEGSTLSMATPSKAAVPFFRANKNVCVDWFARMRQPVVIASVANDSPHDILEHGVRRICELASVLEKSKPKESRKSRKKEDKEEKRTLQEQYTNAQLDVEYTLVYIAKSLCTLRDTDGLIGLSAMLQSPSLPATRATPQRQFASALSHVSSHFEPIVQALVFISKGQYQNGVAALHSVLENVKGPNENGPLVRFVMDSLTDCYINLSDYDSLKIWTASLRKRRVSTMPSHSKAFIAALSSFDSRHLDEATTVLRQSPAVRSQDSMSPYALLKQCDIELLHCLCAESTGQVESASTHLNNLRDGLRNCASIIGEYPGERVITTFDTPYKMSTLSTCCNIIADRLNNGSVGDRMSTPAYLAGVSETHTDASQMASLLRVCQRQPAHEEVILKAATVARKHQNIQLANRLHQKLSAKSADVRIEFARLKHASGQIEEAVRLLFDVKAALAQKANECGEQYELVCGTLAEWLQIDGNSREPKLDMARLGAPTLTHEIVAGEVLREVVETVPSSSRATLACAAWSYSRGARTMERIHNDGDQITFEDQENAELLAICESLTLTATEQEAIFTVLRTFTVSPGEMDTPAEDNPSNELSSFVAATLRARVPILDIDQVGSLMEVWRRARRRVLAPFAAASRHYFRFMHLQHEQECPLSSEDADSCPAVPNDATAVITTTLRLLKIIVKYGQDLPDIVREGVRESPATCWRHITPQLFARLGHPNAFVREQLECLLSRIAVIHPHAVSFSSLTARSEEPQAAHIATIQDTVAAIQPNLVAYQQILIEQLKLITSLREERWLNTLTALRADISARSRVFTDEVARVTENETLSKEEQDRIIAEKYAAITAPINATLATLYESTCGDTVEMTTAREVWFVDTFKDRISTAIANLRSPSDCTSLDEAYQPLKEILRDLIKVFRNSMRVALADIAPILVSNDITQEMESAKMPMLGMGHGDECDDVYISGFASHATILPTKTRPKKFIIQGSDGNMYPYLLKGHEDLHLDERISQLLSVMNCVLRTDKSTAASRLCARNYAVIPLADTSGVIQWVDGFAPIYAVYKSWRRRMLESGTSVPTRPFDIFQSKLHPALKAAGLSINSRRSEWPKEVLLTVFRQLSEETPSDLLSKELWCSSPSSAHYFTKTREFAHSVAVMSMIGYVIGLGDRHLDNMLLDVRTGHVLHIDYNICFDRGAKLRIPETVPFRLTQIIECALGLSGVEGSFRQCSERVLSVMRVRREMLLTLLEAFVYDPITDWTSGSSNSVKKNQELAVSLRLYASRVDEMNVFMKQRLSVYRQCLLPLHQSIAAISGPLRKLASLYSDKTKFTEEFEHLKKEIIQYDSRIEAHLEERKKVMTKKRACTDQIKKAKQQLRDCALKETAKWCDANEQALSLATRHEVAFISGQVTEVEGDKEESEWTAFAEDCETAITILSDPDAVRLLNEVKSKEQAMMQARQARILALEQCCAGVQAYLNHVHGDEGLLLEYNECSEWRRAIKSMMAVSDFAAAQERIDQVVCAYSDTERDACARIAIQTADALVAQITESEASLASLREKHQALSITCEEAESQDMLKDVRASMQQESDIDEATGHCIAASLMLYRSELHASTDLLSTCASVGDVCLLLDALVNIQKCAGSTFVVDRTLGSLKEELLRVTACVSEIQSQLPELCQEASCPVGSGDFSTFAEQLSELATEVKANTHSYEECTAAIEHHRELIAEARESEVPSKGRRETTVQARLRELMAREYELRDQEKQRVVLVRRSVRQLKSVCETASPLARLCLAALRIYSIVDSCTSIAIDSLTALVPSLSETIASLLEVPPVRVAQIVVLDNINAAISVYKGQTDTVNGEDGIPSHQKATYHFESYLTSLLNDQLLPILSTMLYVCAVSVSPTLHSPSDANLLDHVRFLIDSHTHLFDSVNRYASTHRATAVACHDLESCTLSIASVEQTHALASAELKERLVREQMLLLRYMSMDEPKKVSKNTLTLVKQALRSHKLVLKAMHTAKDALDRAHEHATAICTTHAQLEDECLSRCWQSIHPLTREEAVVTSLKQYILDRRTRTASVAGQCTRILSIASSLLTLETFRMPDAPLSKQLYERNYSLVTALQKPCAQWQAHHTELATLVGQEQQAEEDKQHAKERLALLSSSLSAIASKLKHKELSTALFSNTREVRDTVQQFAAASAGDLKHVDELHSLTVTLHKSVGGRAGSSVASAVDTAAAQLHSSSAIIKNVHTTLAAFVKECEKKSVTSSTLLRVNTVLFEQESLKKIMTSIEAVDAAVAAAVGSCLDAVKEMAEQEESRAEEAEEEADEGEGEELAPEEQELAQPRGVSGSLRAESACVLRQQRNQYALGVLKRTRQKLEGRVGAEKLSVREQVTSLVEQAAAPDRLCALYEGWTPWI